MKYEQEYLPADKFVVINSGDSVLRPVILSLPNPPDIKLIDGYGLPKWEQKFHRRETPQKLKLIEKRARKRIEEYNEAHTQTRWNGYHVQREFWKIIDEEKDSLEEEIKWIKNIWWYLRYGYWFFNYGKPTWVTPWHFFYLNFYFIDEAKCYPEYRDVDRRTEVAEWYAYTCTETFAELDNKGNALSPKMKEMANKVFFGTCRPKRRRGGATAQSLAKGLWIMFNEQSAYCEIVADTGPHAKGIFDEKLSPAWYHLELFIKPVWDGEERPAKNIILIHPKTVLKEDCIGSVFGYTETSTDKANDSRKLCYLLSDEEGKGLARGNAITRWGINKETMAQLLQIRGYSNHPSTIEEMEDGGGDFKTMFEELSDFYVRKPSGQTPSGLLQIFTNSPDGMDGFIDPWGYSIIDTPTEDQIKYAPVGNSYVSIKKGARQVLREELDSYLNDGSEEKLKEYRKLLRKRPMDSTDCWKGVAGDIGFNIIIIDKAIIDSRYAKIYRGNFYWKGGIRDTEVLWRDDTEGRWMVTDFLIGRNNKETKGISNHFDEIEGKYVWAKRPINPLITTLGIDPFAFRSASLMRSKSFGGNTSLSDGAGSVFLNYDPLIDGKKTEHDYETQKFICDYLARPPLDEFCEDMIMTFVYFQSMASIERNQPYIIDYIIKRGYAGHLLYMMDANGRVELEPGIWSGGVTKSDMLNITKFHIDKRGHAEVLPRILNDWKLLSSPEDLHRRDLCASAGWALYGEVKGYQKKYDRITQGRSLDLTGTFLGKQKIR